MVHTDRYKDQDLFRKKFRNVTTIFEAFPFRVDVFDSGMNLVFTNRPIDAISIEMDGHCSENDAEKKPQHPFCHLDCVKNDGFTDLCEPYLPNLEKWLSSRLFPLKTPSIDGEELYINISQDLTEKKLIETDLRMKESSLREAQKIGRMGNWDWDIENNSLFWSEEIYRIFGLDHESFGATYEAFLNTIHPNDQDLVKDSVRTALETGKKYSIEHRILLPDNTEKIVHERGQVYFNKAGEPIRMLGTVQDVTDRVLTHRALVENEEKYRSLFESSPDAIIVMDIEGKIIDSNSKTTELSPFDWSSFIGKMFDTIGIFGDDFNERFREFITAIISGESPSEFELYLPYDADDRWLEVNVGLVNLSDETTNVIIILRDITERKSRSIEIERHRGVLRSINMIFRESLDYETEQEIADKCLSYAIDLTGSQFGFIGEVNPLGTFDTIAISPPGWGQCKFPNDEALDMLRNMQIDSYWGRTITDRKAQLVNEPINDPDQKGVPEGHPKIESFMGVPLFHGESIVGMIALANKKGGFRQSDLTGMEAFCSAYVQAMMRKRAEWKVHNSLKQKEVLLKEVHHRVKNNMQVVISLLKLKGKQIEDPEFAQVFQESQDRIYSIALVHELMYGTSDLSMINFSSYLNKLGSHLITSYGFESKPIKLLIPPADVCLDIEMSVPCGLIMSELISNSLKHAFPAGQPGFIKIDLSEDKEAIYLKYSDDGAGLPKELDINKPGSLGLHLVQILSKQVNGVCKISHGPGFTADIMINKRR